MTVLKINLFLHYILIFFQVVKIIRGGGGTIYSPPQIFSWGGGGGGPAATAPYPPPPPPPGIDASGDRGKCGKKEKLNYSVLLVLQNHGFPVKFK